MKVIELYNFILNFIKDPNPDKATEMRAAYPKLRRLAENNNMQAQFYLAELHNNPALGSLYRPQVANYWYNQAQINGHPAVKFKRFAISDAKDSKNQEPSVEPTIQYFSFNTSTLLKNPANHLKRRTSFFCIQDAKNSPVTYIQASISAAGSNGFGRIFKAENNKTAPELFVKTPINGHPSGLIEEAIFNKKVYSGYVQLFTSNKNRLITPVFGECDLRDALRTAKDDFTKINLLIVLLKEILRLHQLRVVHCDVTAYNFRVLRINEILSVYAIDLANSVEIGKSKNTWQEVYRLHRLASYPDPQQLQAIVERDVKKTLEKTHHLAPEVIHGKQFVGAPSVDIYSVGYLIQRYFENYIDYPHLQPLVLKCFSKKPTERPSIESLFIALEECLRMNEQLQALPACEP